MKKTKLFKIVATCMCLVISSVALVFGVWAATQQSFNATSSVSFTSLQVDAIFTTMVEGKGALSSGASPTALSSIPSSVTVTETGNSWLWYNTTNATSTGASAADAATSWTIGDVKYSENATTGETIKYHTMVYNTSPTETFNFIISSYSVPNDSTNNKVTGSTTWRVVNSAEVQQSTGTTLAADDVISIPAGGNFYVMSTVTLNDINSSFVSSDFGPYTLNGTATKRAFSKVNVTLTGDITGLWLYYDSPFSGGVSAPTTTFVAEQPNFYLGLTEMEFSIVNGVNSMSNDSQMATRLSLSERLAPPVYSGYMSVSGISGATVTLVEQSITIGFMFKLLLLTLLLILLILGISATKSTKNIYKIPIENSIEVFIIT